MDEAGPFIKRYVPLSALIDTLTRREIALMDPQTWPDRNDSYFMDLYKAHRKLPALYALCAANGAETFHHWGVFANGMDGVCLEFKRRPLEQALVENPNVKFGKVGYLKLQEVDQLTESDVERLPFSKRSGYIDEDEYRIVLWTDQDQQNSFRIPIDVAWVNRIYLSPRMPNGVADSVKACLRSLNPDCEKLKIRRSLLIDSKRWKDAGDKVVGKKSAKPLAKISEKGRLALRALKPVNRK